MDFDAMIRQAMRRMENDMYNGIILDVFFSDEPTEEEKATLEFFYAMNRRGVSSKTMFEALKEAGRKVVKNE